MIRCTLSPTTLLNLRFAYSPLAECGFSLRLLLSPQPLHVHDAWLRRVRTDLQDAVDAGLDLDLLLGVSGSGRWATDFLFPKPATREDSISDQLQRLALLDPITVREVLVRVFEGKDLPGGAQRVIAAGDRGPQLIADALWDYWTVAIAPYWDRMRAVLEDDIAHRSTKASSGGLSHVLAGLHPEVSLDGDVLEIDKPRHSDAHYSGTYLTLVPAIFIWPGLAFDHADDHLEIAYAARGVGRVWEDLESQSISSSLGNLIGQSRASILNLLAVPMSTTEIARTLAQAPAAVSRHLSILRESGMVVSWRSGRSVLYRRTLLGNSVIGGQRPPRTAGETLVRGPRALREVRA